LPLQAAEVKPLLGVRRLHNAEDANLLAERLLGQHVAIPEDPLAHHPPEPLDALGDLGVLDLLGILYQQQLIDLATRGAERLQRGGEMEVAGLHAHRVTAIESEDFVLDRGARLGGANPGEDLLLPALVL